LKRETGHQKFTFAELENRQDLHKLEDWLPENSGAAIFSKGSNPDAAVCRWLSATK